VIAVNKAAIAAEARYEIAASWFAVGRLPDAEKAAFEVVNKSGSYEYWVTKAYILLGDVYFRQKDYFNAESHLPERGGKQPEYGTERRSATKLDAVNAEEKSGSKLTNQ
jgi:hypothetical protein